MPAAFLLAKTTTYTHNQRHDVRYYFISWCTRQTEILKLKRVSTRDYCRVCEDDRAQTSMVKNCLSSESAAVVGSDRALTAF